MNTNQDLFIEFLEMASNEVKQWPVWKKRLLGGVRIPPQTAKSDYETVIIHNNKSESLIDWLE